MKAIVCSALGPPGGLAVEEVDVPAPGPGEAAIDVHAAGVNFADALMVAGQYQVRPPLPFVPGMELAGVVAALGQDVAGPAVGTRVLARAGHGAFAERAVVPAASAVAIPDEMPFPVAAAFAVAYGTGHVGLVDRAALQAGETLLVHGAGGGVGLAAVEIGKRLGATVIATAGSPEKLELARSRGADHLVNHREEPFRDRVKALTGGAGADVIYDPVGGDVLAQSLRCIRWKGRLLVVGFASGEIPEIPANLLLVKNVSAVGLFWGAYADNEPETQRASLETLLGWYAEGGLDPYVSRTVPLGAAGEALQALLERSVTGKMVVQVR